MKLKKLTFNNGQVAYASDNIEVELNNQLPKKIEHIEMFETEAKQLFHNPGEYHKQKNKDKQNRKHDNKH